MRPLFLPSAFANLNVGASSVFDKQGLPDILGTLGVGVIVFAYILLQIGRLRSEQLAYSIMNAVGATLILTSLYYSFNFPSFVVEFFWLIISLFGISKYLLKR